MEVAAVSRRKPPLTPDAILMVLDQAVTPPATLGRWELPKNGSQGGCLKSYRPAPVGGQRHQAAPLADLQTVHRQAIREQVLGRDRALSRSAAKSADPVLR